MKVIELPGRVVKEFLISNHYIRCFDLGHVNCAGVLLKSGNQISGMISSQSIQPNQSSLQVGA